MSRRLGRGFPNQPTYLVGAVPGTVGDQLLAGRSTGTSVDTGSLGFGTVLLAGQTNGTSIDSALLIGGTFDLAGTSTATSRDTAILSGGTPVGGTPLLIRETPPLRVDISVVTPTGRHYRWAQDEASAADVPSQHRHSDTMPGGFEQWSAVLPRQTGVDYADLKQFSTLTVHGAGGRVAGEYRLDAIPRASGDQMSVNPRAVGWQAHLDDNKSARAIYRDADLSRWRDPGRARQLLLGQFPSVIAGHEVIADPVSGTPALAMTIHGPWATRFFGEAYYDSEGIGVGSMWAEHQINGGPDLTDSGWNMVIFATDDEVTFTQLDTLRTVIPTTPGTVGRATVNNAAQTRELMVQFSYNPASGGEIDYTWWLRRAVVYGRHGLPLRGTEPDAGFYASDVVTHAVSTFAPLLRIANGSVQRSSFVIPHLVFLESTTAAEIVRAASRFDLPDWAVWEDKTFWWTERGGQARRWRARIGPAELQETGPQTDRLWESIVVQYQDVDGSTRTVGPPGSGTDTESSLLKDSDPGNPANQLGVTKRDLLGMGICTPAGAIEVGRRFLAESLLLDRSGQARAVGYIEDDRGVLHPYWAPRAGDEVAFVDASDKSYRRITRTEKDHDARTISFDLDAPPEGLAQLLERLGVVLIPHGIGS